MLREPGRSSRREFQQRPDSAWVVARPAVPPATPSPVANGLLHRYEAESITSARLANLRWQRPVVGLPFSAVRQISRLRPTHLRWLQGRCGDRRQERVTRYRHRGQVALFDGQGHRLTGFVYRDLDAAGPNCLAYTTDSSLADGWKDMSASWASAMAPSYALQVDQEWRRYGMLDRRGRRLTPARYARLLQVGPNAVWAVAGNADTLTYGLLDTLGRVVLPFAAGPLSLPDTAGLVRRRSAAPVRDLDRSYRSGPALYPDSTTINYYRLDGRLAFAGRFAEAGPFWEGRALVLRGTEYGFIDEQGRWLISLEAAGPRAASRSPRHTRHDDDADPLRLF